MIRTEAPTGAPYPFGVESEGQCTWYSYWRAYEALGSKPCWYDGCGDSGYGYYTNAKLWLEHFRDPWEVKDRSYDPVPGDIVVWDGNYGHVAYVEKNNGDGTAYLSQYNMDGDCKFSNCNWKIGKRITRATVDRDYKYSTGEVLGYLHFPRQNDVKAQLIEVRNLLDKIIEEI